MPFYLVVAGEAPVQSELLLGSSRPMLRRVTAYELAKKLLREGGGATKPDPVWTLIKANELDPNAAETLGAQVLDRIVARGQFVIPLSDLQIPTHALYDIANATGTIVYLAAVFEPDPNSTTWQEPVDARAQ
ncbi:MAG TPA: hypothetical protein VGG20_15665 [Thermoanaerobaculia bacterium]